MNWGVSKADHPRKGGRHWMLRRSKEKQKVEKVSPSPPDFPRCLSALSYPCGNLHHQLSDSRAIKLYHWHSWVSGLQMENCGTSQPPWSHGHHLITNAYPLEFWLMSSYTLTLSSSCFASCIEAHSRFRATARRQGWCWKCHPARWLPSHNLSGAVHLLSVLTPSQQWTQPNVV